MERRTAAKWLFVIALACFGFLGFSSAASAQEGTTVQGTQSSDASTAETGTVGGSNTAAFNGGPSASGGTGASAQQLGSNTGTVSQSGTAKSGDPVAGSQVTGVVGSNATIQNQNSATAPSAVSGDVAMANTAAVVLGPSATTDAGAAQAAQIGDNRADVTQSFTAQTGDAVAGSQVTGIVGGGEHTVQNQNSVDGAGTALSGDLDLVSVVAVVSGPLATSGDGDAQAGQIGSNDAVITQAVEASTGDAVYGSQVTGIVGGSATVQQQNAADGLGAEIGSGDTTVTVLAIVVSGPFAQAVGGDAQASQNGDNTADLLQDVEVASGDAVGGSQVTGAVGDEGGFLVVQNQQASDDFVVDSGDVTVGGGAVVIAGALASSTAGLQVPSGDAQASQIGDNDVAIAQDIEIGSGDAVAGSQVTGAVGYSDVTVQNQNSADFNTATSGDVEVDDFAALVVAGPVASSEDGDAQASQFGDNDLSVAQEITITTGDAVAGGQVTGVVATGSEVVIQNQNAGDGNVATSGSILDADLTVGLVAGPVAAAPAGDAQATQFGDNSIVADQSVEISTGDAVAGSQVTGVVAGDHADITVQNQNSGDGNIATSGTMFDADLTVIVNAGPLAAGEISLHTDPAELEILAAGDDAQASQIGDNSIDVAQSVNVGTGDAVAGSQVTGVVAGHGSDITIQNQNSAADNFATSGNVEEVIVDASIGAGPTASAFDDAQAEQIGDNSVTATQSVEVATGDAVSGSQVTGVVAGWGSDVTIQNQNASEFNIATSGSVLLAENNLDVNAGPSATSEEGDAQAQQFGDNDLVFAQEAIVSSGDAVAGSQVTGVVGGNEAVIQVQGTDEGSGALSGTVFATNTAGGGLTASAVAPLGDADAQQIGDGTFDGVQDLTFESGDAVAGSQVTGQVGTGGTSATTRVSGMI